MPEPLAARAPERPWLVAWLGGAAIGVANGALRELTYGKKVSENTAHQVSGLTGVAAFAVYFRALHRRWPLASTGSALRVGGVWLLLTIAFEFCFGRLVAKESWKELLAAYDMRRGSTWPLVLLWIALGPAATRRR